MDIPALCQTLKFIFSALVLIHISRFKCISFHVLHEIQYSSNLYRGELKRNEVYCRISLR